MSLQKGNFFFNSLDMFNRKMKMTKKKNDEPENRPRKNYPIWTTERGK